MTDYVEAIEEDVSSAYIPSDPGSASPEAGEPEDDVEDDPTIDHEPVTEEGAP